MKHATAASLIVAALLATAALTPATAQTGPVAEAPATSAAPAADPAAAPAVPATAANPPNGANNTNGVNGANGTTTAPNPVRPAQQLGVPAAPYSAAPSGGGLLQTTFALFFVIALLVGGAWVLKRFGPRGFGGGSNTVKLVGALSVGARERILVVEVGEQWIVVGASPGRMNALATMPRQDTVDAPVQAMAAPANFADWFKQTIDKRNGKQ